MATQLNIEDTHSGEPLVILLEAKQPNGDVIDNPSLQTVIFTIGRTEDDNSIYQADDQPEVLLLDENAGTWLIEIPDAKISGLQEDRVYFYNVWTMINDKYRLQGHGRLKRLPSIKPRGI